jgi:ferrous iron transport protein A
MAKKESDDVKTEPEITLNLLEPGNKAKVIHLQGRGSARKRILDMGMVPGVEVEVIKKAPLGDPIEFKVKGYNLSLRKTEAELVVVQPIEK